MSEIHMTATERLVLMANQIARAFAPLGEARAVPKVAAHIASFWDPRMRRMIAEHLAAGGAGLTPYALAAIGTLSESATATATATAPEPMATLADTSSAAPRWRFRLPGFSRRSRAGSL